MPDATFRYRIITRSQGGDRLTVAPPPGWPSGEYSYDTMPEAAEQARQFNRACGSPTIDPYKTTATYQVRRERVATVEAPTARRRPILLANDVPAADGKTYRVFVDVDDVALRRAVPHAVGNTIARSVLMLDALAIRLEEQP